MAAAPAAGTRTDEMPLSRSMPPPSKRAKVSEKEKTVFAGVRLTFSLVQNDLSP